MRRAAEQAYLLDAEHVARYLSLTLDKQLVEGTSLGEALVEATRRGKRGTLPKSRRPRNAAARADLHPRRPGQTCAGRPGSDRRCLRLPGAGRSDHSGRSGGQSGRLNDDTEKEAGNERRYRASSTELMNELHQLASEPGAGRQHSVARSTVGCLTLGVSG